MTTYVLDTHAWVEYFRGTEKGKKVDRLFRSKSNKFLTLECCAAELFIWSQKNYLNFQALYEVVHANSNLSPIVLDDWLNGAEIREEMRKTRKKFGLIDALMLSRQREIKGRIVSGDLHFKDLPNVIFL